MNDIPNGWKIAQPSAAALSITLEGGDDAKTRSVEAWINAALRAGDLVAIVRQSDGYCYVSDRADAVAHAVEQDADDAKKHAEWIASCEGLGDDECECNW